MSRKVYVDVRILATFKQNIGAMSEKRANDILDNLELGFQYNSTAGDIEPSDSFTLEKLNVSGSLILKSSIVLLLDDGADVGNFKVSCRGTDTIKKVEVLDFKVTDSK